jgi:hypothetical protein
MVVMKNFNEDYRREEADFTYRHNMMNESPSDFIKPSKYGNTETNPFGGSMKSENASMIEARDDIKSRSNVEEAHH